MLQIFILSKHSLLAEVSAFDSKMRHAFVREKFFSSKASFSLIFINNSPATKCIYIWLQGLDTHKHQHQRPRYYREIVTDQLLMHIDWLMSEVPRLKTLIKNPSIGNWKKKNLFFPMLSWVKMYPFPIPGIKTDLVTHGTLLQHTFHVTGRSLSC